MQLSKPHQGFTIIELMIVIGIIGIITVIAFPSYQSMIDDAARSTAQGDLMSLAAAMERHNASNFTYNGAALNGADTGAPNIFASHSPSSEPVAKARYNLAIDTVSTNGLTYRLRATPVTGDSLADDGPFYLFSDGRKGWDKNRNGSLENTEYCWAC